jgi:hypothetical protein
MYGADGGGGGAHAGGGHRDVRLPLRVHASQSASLARHVSWNAAAPAGAAAGAADAAAEGRPLLAGTLRAARSGSFARLKSLSLGGSGYDAMGDAYADGDDGGGGGDGGGAGGPGGGGGGAPEAHAGAWHRCNASVGAPPAFVAHFALGAGTFIQGRARARPHRPRPRAHSHPPGLSPKPPTLCADTARRYAPAATTKPRWASCWPPPTAATCHSPPGNKAAWCPSSSRAASSAPTSPRP